jgi:hypothetical protein
MRQAGSSEPAADGGGRAHHDAVLAQFGLDLHQRDVGFRIEGARTSVPCGSRIGPRWPPKRAGTGLPLWRKRRISFTAADVLTSKRKAACRMEDPPATARTIRSRKSRDRGAGMGCLLTNHNQLYGIGYPDFTQPLHALNI